MRRPVRLGLWFCLLLVAGAGLGGCAPQPRAEITIDPAVADQPLRVMSFNLRYGLAADGDDAWDRRQPLVGDVITAFAPDLLGVQECLEFQAEFVAGQLPDHDFVGAGRDDGGTGGEMCGIFFRREFFEELKSGHFWLSETPEVVASKGWDAALTRMASWVILRTRGAQPVTFLFINTHLDHVGPTARHESAKVIVRQLAVVAPGLPVILTGDFNAPADSTVAGPYRVLTGGGELVDSYRVLFASGPEEGTFNGFRGERTGARIDWILSSADWSVQEAAIVHTERRGRYPSDHFPVIAVLGLPARRE